MTPSNGAGCRSVVVQCQLVDILRSCHSKRMLDLVHPLRAVECIGGRGTLLPCATSSKRSITPYLREGCPMLPTAWRRVVTRLRDLLLPFTVLHHPAGQQGQKIPDASGRQSSVMSASNANDPLRADLDKLQKMLEENRSKCAEAKMRLEARAVAEKDGEAGWDQFYAEIRGKIHSLMDDSREIRTSHISMEVLLEASRQIHHESLAAIGAFAEERRAQRDAEHEELWRLIGELNQSR